MCSHASLDSGPLEPEERGGEEWPGWRESQPPTQESGYGSLGCREEETDCCESLEETNQASTALVSQLTQTVSKL